MINTIYSEVQNGCSALFTEKILSQSEDSSVKIGDWKVDISWLRAFWEKNFPAKKLRKNTGAYNTHASIISLITFVKCGEFSRQKTCKKYGAQNTHAPFLKKKIKIYSILLISLIIFVVVLYCHLVAINKVPWSVCVLFFYCPTYVLNKPQVSYSMKYFICFEFSFITS